MTFIEASDRQNSLSESAANDSTSASRWAGCSPAFWMAYWLAAGLAGIKFFYFGRPDAMMPGVFANYVWTLIVATSADNLFALTMGILTGVTLFPLAGRHQLRAWVLVLWTVIYAVCLIYSVANAYILAITQCPLTRALIEAAGTWSNIKSSVLVYIEDTAVSALLSVPLAFVLIVFACCRYVGVPKRRVVKGVIGLLVLAVLGQWVYARRMEAQWTRRLDYHIAANAQWTLLTSWVEPLGELKFRVPPNLPASFSDEFKPVRDRSGKVSSQGGKVFVDQHSPRNVVLFVLESTSTQFLHIYGSSCLTTPKLDEEASRSIIMTNFYSHAGMTVSAMVTINSSNYARARWQANPNGAATRLNQPGILLAEVLKSHGYRTLAISSASFTFGSQLEFMENRGFDTILDQKDLRGEVVSSWGKTDGAMVDRLIQWIDESPSHSTPFFALCWTNQTHHPYSLPQGVREEKLLNGDIKPLPRHSDALNLYLNDVKESDRQLGKLFAALRSRRIADDTLVIIVGDHGEGFRYPHDAEGHGLYLFEENQHVPCIVWNNGRFIAPEMNPALSGQIDLAPTIVDLLGFQPAPTWQGRSFFDPSRSPRVYFFSMLNDYFIGAREADWKYICNASISRDELYNLRDDPREQLDVSATHPDICRNLRDHTAAWIAYQAKNGAGVRP